ncbi:hypothetical protein SAMN02746065_107155 [Desulfocicer vacuolatum DSM 3385]|uniref:Uncharacterized protein n=1 Tax=Desulfocicer vacuolatum DSM 3385 TaxID=1121400 RepID=A0A1W2B909_9BACT|nr:hypothetical protein [Desulfocicer vacuolatum]SMC69503.1 hypothetical protein SAMN02746065_107155 [Desulfocicer vacuolatum DSM 3385]
MYSTIFSAMAKLLKPVWKWLFRFIISLIISNAVLWLLRYSASGYVQKFHDEIVQFVKEKNKKVLDQIFNVGDFLNEIMDTVFQMGSEMVLTLEALIDDSIKYTTGLVDQVLACIPFTERIEQIVQDCMDDISILIQNQATGIVNTFFAGPVIDLNTLISTAKLRIDALEVEIAMYLMETWLAIVSPVQTGITTAYEKVLSLSESLNGLVSFCNGSIDTMENAMTSACNQLDYYNLTLEEQKADLLWMIEQELNENQTGGTGANLQCIRQELENKLLISEPGGLNIDFSRFRTDPPQIDPDEYLCKVQMIENTFTFDMNTFLPDFDDMITHLSTIHTKLSELEKSLITALDDSLPGILKGNMEGKIRDLLFIALVETLKRKKINVSTYLQEKSTALTTEKEARKQEIIQKKDEIITNIQTFETETIDSIQVFLDPSVNQLIKDLEAGIASNEDISAVNIDNVLPDTTDIDSIITTFDANIHANETPNITDSVKWTPADIYRILKHNFTKSDRVPLLVHLFSQDLKINAEKLKELQLKWIPKP